LESLVSMTSPKYIFLVKSFPIIPVALALVGAGFIVAALSGFSERPAPKIPAQIMAESAASSPSSYPLTTCLVSGEKLGEMGPPIMVDYKGQKIGFCCKSCIGDFNKDPAKYLAKLKATTSKP